MMPAESKYRIMRITTVPLSLHKLLKGQMAYMVRSGFDVLMVSADGPEIPAITTNEGCPHRVVHMTRKLTPFQDLVSLWNLFILIRKYRPHIVHTHTPKAGLLGMLAAKIAGVPIRMHTVAGLPWMETSGIRRSVLKWAERLTAWSAQYVYVNSRSLRTFMVEEQVVTDVEKLNVLGAGTSNGINLDYFNRQHVHPAAINDLLNASGISKQGKVWLFVGRLVLDKGIQELVEAFHFFQKQFPEDQLWLVGPAEDHKAIPDALYKSITENASIKMWGYQDDVRPFMMAAHALVFPSYREGFPNVPLQAAAMECPLILSDINGCNELVTNNENGLLVPVKDHKALNLAMLRMRNEEDMKLAFIEKTLQIVRVRYSQQQIHQSLKSEYLTALHALKGKIWN
jgi:glycosyltransferase involved in cell wall biosynthesis